ncbi:putative small G-protein Ras2 [Xylariaceae sp. FL0255]|nr:putative small G-protein Ras2 [Xylariaceae sp. FL0255]
MYSTTQVPQVAILGDEGVGKTSIAMRACNRGFDPSYDPTIQDSVQTWVTIGGVKHPFLILDTGGQEEYANLRDISIRQSDGFVLVYDVTSMRSFRNLRDLLNQILQVKGWTSEEPVASRLARPPITIVGNKIDTSEEWEVPTHVAWAFSCKFGCKFIEASAQLNLKADEAVFDVVNKLVPLLQASGNDEPSDGSRLGSIWNYGSCCTIM